MPKVSAEVRAYHGHLHTCRWCGTEYECPNPARPRREHRRGRWVTWIANCDTGTCSVECRDAWTRDTAIKLRQTQGQLGEQADKLNEALDRAEEGLRSRGFAVTASVPVEYEPLHLPARRRRSKHGQLLWAEHDGEWRLLWIDAGGLKPLRSAPLWARAASGHVLEDLLWALVQAEDA